MVKAKVKAASRIHPDTGQRGRPGTTSMVPEERESMRASDSVWRLAIADESTMMKQQGELMGYETDL